MNTREMATQYKMVQWKQIIQERTASGMNITEFCAQRGITRQAYHYWQTKLREAAAQQLAGSAAEPEKVQQALVPSGWAQACIAEERTPEQETGALTLRVGGAEIEVRRGFDEALLASVIKTLSSVC